MARELKDSGVPWIGEIPITWHLGKVSYFFDIQLGKMLQPSANNDADTLENYLCAANLGGNKLKLDIIKQMWFSQSDKEKFVVHKGDLLVVEGGDVASCAIISEDVQDLYIQNALHRVRSSVRFDVRLLRYFLIIAKAQGYIDLICNKATIAHFTKDKFAAIPYPVMPIDEQNKIASFLDTECARIDAVIEKTRASIEEYKKLKQAVITRAVTKGIHSDRLMKDSGIEWIGYIPESWRVTKLKYFSKIRSGITLGKTYPSGTELYEYPYLRVANVQGSFTDLRDVATIKVTSEEAVKYRLQPGELLMTEGGDRDKLGRGTIWHGEIDPCLHQNHVFALRTNDKDLLAEYVSFLSDSYVGRDYFDVTANQSVYLASTNSTTILNFTIPFPPIDEQREIITFLTAKVKEIEQMIKSKERLLAELESYKKSLIYEYVTGKKEVPA